MRNSLFELAFEHVDRCEVCDLSKSRLCSDGALLFAAAYEKCETLAGVMATGPRGEA